MKYDKCPRCGGEWSDVVHTQTEGHILQYCKNGCSMNRNCLQEEYGYSVTISQYDVVWWYKRHPNEQCSIYPSSPPNSTRLILETILPFTVTEEMIRMLLVFQ